ncbi:phytanoyl-CoA dioxygenase family protein [Bradyrhizobium sp. U87765 SZCCT0131]|uniref:phytanoyl-CoA dioxygenase family protein n=1 Tax=unclassified Bradyrhizobium TaxID=2631580 RepID=UPI001BA83410|nr:MULTISPECIES: phytanoyl-CoA dioxygenase family protein [unclassified Bradyrhizobium]MBR1222229.1 phytanoyl-CoA dioxygenase family protein [Bradyrhizobium sp. U87765 SZCCT0131]MBR1264287.1 phytanoyl-CoA dioxygenase family protein [Bradyrhizobium sp. U87765 SZCCT0134]MBR1307930.1 phytanoyl-CoA dioxygenase family protein [Bradyrhizobium sp. U87765 SZCCT0110]MBR1320537.1 phytanoyl-CoA dioxygenase family protein [Bradyrhizobium sp. U87765 SZCCT0109]MBR1348350.1 phytanoyl-CoA dioxygenase family p
MPLDTTPTRALDAAQINRFIHDGFVRIDDAFPRALADEGRAILWRDLPCDPHDPATWTQPVIRLWYYDDPPFRQAVNTPVLRAAFDQLVGKGRWLPRSNLGSFPVRFPGTDDPGDTGWHVDVSFPDETAGAAETDFSAWRVNVTSRGRALLMLFLFSDIGPHDAPTRLRVGSHRDMARLLAPAGDAGLNHLRLAEVAADRPEALAVGPAGTVYLCHPFLIHAAQAHRGATPRFLAQPPLHPAQPLQIARADGAYAPVEEAIRLALQEA